MTGKPVVWALFDSETATVAKALPECEVYSFGKVLCLGNMKVAIKNKELVCFVRNSRIKEKRGKDRSLVPPGLYQDIMRQFMGAKATEAGK